MLELPYVAGIIDGEGWIGFNTANQGHQLKITVEVHMTCFELIDLLHKQFDGSVRERPLRSGKKAIKSWQVVSKNAVALLVQIYPFLVVKRRQATLALQFYNYQNENKYRPDMDINELFKSKMHLLNKRGRYD